MSVLVSSPFSPLLSNRSAVKWFSFDFLLTSYLTQVGPSWTEEINKELDEEEAELKAIRQNEIDACKNSIDAELQEQASAGAWADIIQAKKEAVGLQLEAAYRARLVEAHQQVMFL